MTATKKTLICTYKYLHSVNHTAAETHAHSELAAVRSPTAAAEAPAPSEEQGCCCCN